MTGVSVGGTAVAGNVSVGGGGAEALGAKVAVFSETAVGASVGKAGWLAVIQADKNKSSTPCKSKAKCKKGTESAATRKVPDFFKLDLSVAMGV
jgi:hypothetical protein